MIAAFEALTDLCQPKVVGLRPKFKTTAEYLFLQSNFGLYFVSLLVANAIAAIGSVMNAHWVIERGVRVGGFCTAQGATKNIGNVATALWTLVCSILRNARD